MDAKPKENWGSADPYERYVGRWSRQVAKEFVGWISVPLGVAWADVGCGTGALAESIFAMCAPKSIAGADRAEGFVAAAWRNVTDPRASFETAPGGKVALYVWDYGRGMVMMRHFWDAVIMVIPHDSKLDQAERFPICQPEPLQALFRDIGLTAVSCLAIDIPTVFRDFEDFWSPFLGKQGAAPTYLASVDDETRERIRALLDSRLVPTADEKIALTARAWAVQGIV